MDLELECITSLCILDSIILEESEFDEIACDKFVYLVLSSNINLNLIFNKDLKHDDRLDRGLQK